MTIKRILAITVFAGFFVFMVWVFAQALDTDTWRSSNTVTADTTKNLCPGFQFTVSGSTQVTEGNHGVLHGICVNRGQAGTFQVWDSSASSNPIPIASISTSTPMPCSFYDVQTSSGLTYSGVAGADVTILYQCF